MSRGKPETYTLVVSFFTTAAFEAGAQLSLALPIPNSEKQAADRIERFE